MPTHKPYTFAIATANAQPKLQKSISFTALSVERKRKPRQLTKTYKINCLVRPYLRKYLMRLT